MNLYDEIKKEAYSLYEKNGMIEGRDIDNWFEAERIVLEKRKAKEGAEEELTEADTMKDMLIKPLSQAKKAPSKEVKKEAPKKRTSAKKTIKKAEPKKEETKKAPKTKKTKK